MPLSIEDWEIIDNKIKKTVDEREKVISIARIDLNELKDIVKSLAISQQKNEEGLDRLTQAQEKTEHRLDSLTIKVGNLAEAQERTEIKMKELAEAQKKTEHRLDTLTIKVGELAEAQKRTENEIQTLTVEVKHIKEDLHLTRKEVGGLSLTVGYSLEDKAYKALPELLKRDYGIIIKGKLKRSYMHDMNGNYLEVNIYGQAEKNGQDIIIIGESKSQLSKNKINEFIRKRLNKFEGEIFPILITHMISEPDVEDYAREKNIALYYSYDF